MQRGGGALRIELAIALDGVCGREHLDLDAAVAQRLERARIRLELPVCAGADEQALGELFEHVDQIVEDERVPFLAPPVAYDAVGEHDDVARLFAPVDRHAPEPVPLDLGHRRDGSVASVSRVVELRRHTDADEDVLTADGVASALAIGARLRGGYHVAISTGAQRATQTLACFLAALGERVPGGVVVEPGLRSQVEDRWRSAYGKAGSGALLALREADPELVADDSERLGAALRRVFESLPADGRALVVGHSPMNEAAVLGLTGEIVAPLAKGAGVHVVATDDGYEVDPLE